MLEKLGTLTTGTTLLARVIFYSLFLSIVGILMTLLMHYAIIMRFCEKVSCQTVGLHGQPQDWKCCASRLVPEEWG